MRSCLGSGEIFLGDSFEGFERAIFGGILGGWNAFARAANKFETALGLRVRCRDRLQFSAGAASGMGGPKFGVLGGASLVVVMRDRGTGALVAAAELALQPPDGALPSNFPSPWGGGNMGGDTGGSCFGLYPYLCNVAVAPSARRRGLGGRLCRLCEQLAKEQWGCVRSQVF